MIQLNKINNNQQHPFHLVDSSPWPFITSFAAFELVVSLVSWMHSFKYGLFFLLLSFCFLVFCMYQWFNNIIIEATFEGHHTKKVQLGLRIGMALFIVSEIMFFFAFFWAFFHSSITPSIGVGCVWPPEGVDVLNPWHIPLLNTLVLLSSGVSVTWAHRAIISGLRADTIKGLFITIMLGIIFTELQLFEYISANFSINDSIYGSVFYLITGFHGFHVLVGTIFLIVCLRRQLNYHFLKEHHFGLEAAIWYWHFVDVVWIFLYISLYCWGGL
jgi:cytochrome c oxidase subunit 3